METIEETYNQISISEYAKLPDCPNEICLIRGKLFYFNSLIRVALMSSQDREDYLRLINRGFALAGRDHRRFEELFGRQEQLPCETCEYTVSLICKNCKRPRSDTYGYVYGGG